MNVVSFIGVLELDKELDKHCTIQKARSAEETLQLVVNRKPDAVIISVFFMQKLNINMLALCESLRINNTRIIVLCGNNTDSVLPLFESGVYDFVVGNRINVYRILHVLKCPMSIDEAAAIFQKITIEQSHSDQPDKQDWDITTGQTVEQPGINKIEINSVEDKNDYFLMKSQNQDKHDEYCDNGPPVVGFWSPKPASGTGTIARAMALTVAQSMKVLLVETDFRYPSAMFSFKIIDDEKCLEKAIQAVQENTGSVSQCILNKQNFKNKTNILIPEGLHILAPSLERGLELFPRVEGEETVKKIHESIRDNYNLIIYDLSSELDSYLTVGAMRQCTHLIVIIDGRPSVMSILDKRINLLKRLKIKVIENGVVITNKMPEEISAQKIQQLYGMKVIQKIPFDKEMDEAVMNMQPGGKSFMRAIENLCQSLGISNNIKQNERKSSSEPIWTQLKGESKKFKLNQLFLKTTNLRRI